MVDVTTLGALVHERQPSEPARAQLRTIHLRYQNAASPRHAQTETMSDAYKLRLFSPDRWNLWDRLTRYRSRVGHEGEVLDRTNNATERAVGWWVKERYRAMRGYKRAESVHNVRRLIAWVGNHLAGPGADLALVDP